MSSSVSGHTFTIIETTVGSLRFVVTGKNVEIFVLKDKAHYVTSVPLWGLLKALRSLVVRNGDL